MTFGERIKNLRKALDLTQQEFADRIGTTRNNIAGYETGRREPSAAAINLILAKLNVDETWLRTGEGEMFIQQSKEDELADAVNRLLSGESSEFKRRLILMLSKLDIKDWEILERRLNEIVGMRPAAPVFTPAYISSSELTLEQQADQYAAKAAELAREQFLSGKKRESEASSAKESFAD